MKIVIAGVGKVGRALTRQLTAAKHDVVVIDPQPDVINNLVNMYDARGVVGNAATYDVQLEAFENGADLLIATSASDEVNIVACLVAKKIGTKHTIARIRNPEYEKQLRFMRNELGLSFVINPEKATAREISRVLRFPSATKLEQFSKQRFELVEYRLGEGNMLCGVPLSSLYASLRIKVLICAVMRGSEVVIPNGSFVLQAGDKIYVTASPKELELFFRKMGQFKAQARNVMLVGGSNTAFYLTKQLLDMKMRVTVIDNDRERLQDISDKLPGVLCIHGDGTDSSLLEEEGLSAMDAFVALTGMDETNIILAMYASQLPKCKVVAKINRREFANLINTSSATDCIVNTPSVVTEQILQYVRAMMNGTGSIKTLHRLVDEKVEAIEFGVTAAVPFVGTPIKDLKLKDGMLIAGIVHANGEAIIPSGKDFLQVGDDVIIVTTNQSLNDLKDIIK